VMLKVHKHVFAAARDDRFAQPSSSGVSLPTLRACFTASMPEEAGGNPMHNRSRYGCAMRWVPNRLVG
jgi:hypothetical protein